MDTTHRIIPLTVSLLLEGRTSSFFIATVSNPSLHFG